MALPSCLNSTSSGPNLLFLADLSQVPMKHIPDFQNYGQSRAGKGMGAEEGGVLERVIAVNGRVMGIYIQEVISQDLCSPTSGLALPARRAQSCIFIDWKSIVKLCMPAVGEVVFYLYWYPRTMQGHTCMCLSLPRCCCFTGQDGPSQPFMQDLAAPGPKAAPGWLRVRPIPHVVGMKEPGGRSPP